MSIRPTVRIAAALPLVVMLLACDNSTAPNTRAGQFTLVSAEEAPLPAAVFEGTIDPTPDPSFHLQIIATSGSITIDANGHYEQHVEHNTIVDGTLAGRLIRADRGECTRVGDQLQCTSTYLEGVIFSGTFGDRTLVIPQDLAGEGHIAAYRYQWTSAVTP
jgi:hypothetical protein